MMTLEDAARMALALPEVTEGDHRWLAGVRAAQARGPVPQAVNTAAPGRML
jgi:hypothetical protein